MSNLWDVTDADIDRFTQELVKKLVPRVKSIAHSAKQSSESSRRDLFNDSDTDECDDLALSREIQSHCNLNRSNLLKAKTTFEDIGFSQSTHEGQESSSSFACCTSIPLTHAINQSRKVCRFPFLIGGAPVCYGLPISSIMENPKSK